MDSAQWPQDIGIVKQPIQAADQMVVSNNNTNPSLIEKRPRPHHKEQAINCPRCNSTNTKFCYYNNYSLTQPRYFCKTCRRYWTQGGSLRNVPVGGGSRKNRRSSSSSSLSVSSTTISKIKLPDLTSPPISKSSAQNPKIHETHDLNLAFPTNDHYHTISEFGELPNLDQNNNNNNSQIPISSSSSSSISGLEFLRSGFTSKGLNTFIPMPVLDQDSTTIYTTTSGGFSLQDFKPNFSFGMGSLGSGGSYGHHDQEGVDHHQESNSASRGLFPFENLRQVSSTNHDQYDHHHNREGGQGDHTNGYWSGMLGGGGGSW